MPSAYEKALEEIDKAHVLDPKQYELHYAQRMPSYLNKINPSASEPLRLAIRAQHFRRWEVRRDSYPMNKIGYHAWRNALKNRQAEQVTEICISCGVPAVEAERVGALIRKENLKKDEETQTLEDVACLVFLDDQFEAFEKEHDEAKIIDILRKTWVKMSDKGHELALQIDMSPRAKSLVEKALST